MADWGIRVSQEGFDVKTAADKNLIINSAFNSLKIFMEDGGSATVDTGFRYTGTSTHNLGYPPSHMCFYKDIFYGGGQYWSCDGGGNYAIPIYDPSSSTTAGTLLGDDSSHRAYSDSTTLKTEIDNLSGVTRTYKNKKFILIEDNA